MNKRVLITGAGGYLGSIVLQKLAQHLPALGLVVGTDIKFATAPLNPEAQGHIHTFLDVRDAEKLTELLQIYQIDTVLHLAAVIDSNSMPEKLQYEIDVLGTENVLKACLSAGVKRLVVSSSGAAYGYHPDNPEWLTETSPVRGNDIFVYSKHKRLVEEMLAEYRQKYPELEQIIFRVGTILGAKTKNLITALFDKKRILGIRGFASPYVFIWDEDAADCFIQAIDSPVVGIFNLAGDGAVENRLIAQMMRKSYLELPEWLLKFALTVGFKLGLSKYSPQQLLFLQYRPVLDNTQLKTRFGFQPQKSSKEVFQYFLDNR